MRELLKTKGFKMTPQRELIFRSFLESGRHVSVEELYDRVRQQDSSIGLTTVWRNLKLICKVGLAEEVNLGDGVTRYDRIKQEPHGHLYCLGCKSFVEFDVDEIMDLLDRILATNSFSAEGYRIEVQGYCSKCLKKQKKAKKKKQPRSKSSRLN